MRLSSMETHSNEGWQDTLELEESFPFILDFLETVKHGHNNLPLKVKHRRVLFGIQEQMHPLVLPIELVELIEENLL